MGTLTATPPTQIREPSAATELGMKSPGSSTRVQPEIAAVEDVDGLGTGTGDVQEARRKALISAPLMARTARDAGRRRCRAAKLDDRLRAHLRPPLFEGAEPQLPLACQLASARRATEQAAAHHSSHEHRVVPTPDRVSVARAYLGRARGPPRISRLERFPSGPRDSQLDAMSTCRLDGSGSV